MRAPKNRITDVVPDPTGKTTGEILATSIRTIADGVKKLRTSGLNDKALVILLQHSSGESQTSVKNVLKSLNDLAKDYLI